MASIRPAQRPHARFAALLLACATLGTAIGARAQSTSTPVVAMEGNAAAKGAQVYCFMRAAGNSHDVSWVAAYALIKRQSASLFKTSPEHAAVMITEAVVQNPGSYPDCGKFLGNLFEKSAAREAAAAAAAAAANAPATTTSPSSDKPAAGTNRYTY